MRRTLLTLAAATLLAAAPDRMLRAQSATATPLPSPNRLMDDVRFLADSSLEGRMTGSPGADSAAAFLARRFEAVGLSPSANGWFQEFTISDKAPAAAHMRIGGLRGRNVIGVLPGRDPKLRGEAVVVGAHYDHLGLGGQFALDPDSTGKVHNGADDNASGTAALIEIARRLAVRPPARSVVFVAFSGEELGLLGSAAYVQHPTVRLARTVAMINLDMVGRLRNNRLIVYGTATAKEFPALLDSLDRDAGFELREIGDGYGPSDQTSFYANKRPVLHLFTDLHEDYHRATDDVERINGDGLKRVADFATSLARALADRRKPLTWVDVPIPAHAAGPVMTPGYGAYLGTVPDMAGDEGQGVRITGVRAGSPAEQAGLRADDIITKIGDMDVPDLQAMTDALRSHKPGDVVEIIVRRGESTTTLRATLGTRGG
jgi:hypothetical protein